MEIMNHDPRPMIRGTAAWAIGKIDGKEAREVLETAYAIEVDESVKQEIAKGLIQ